MGQRHQLFIKAFAGAQYDKKITDKSHISAFHHQWLYGATLASNIKNFLMYFDKTKSDKYYSIANINNYHSPQDLDRLVSISFTFNPNTGYFGKIMDLNKYSEEMKDDTSTLPDYQDNNDGQTFIDFTRTGKPLIGFAWPDDTDMYPEDGIQNEDENYDYEANGIKVKQWYIMSLREYVNLYYDFETFLKDPNNSYYELVKQADRDIKWIEKRTNTMTQKQFFEMYPHLGEGFDEFEYEVIKNSKLIAA